MAAICDTGASRQCRTWALSRLAARVLLRRPRAKPARRAAPCEEQCSKAPGSLGNGRERTWSKQWADTLDAVNWAIFGFPPILHTFASESPSKSATGLVPYNVYAGQRARNVTGCTGDFSSVHRKFPVFQSPRPDFRSIAPTTAAPTQTLWRSMWANFPIHWHVICIHCSIFDAGADRRC
jgi:hypothetical protein